MKQQKEITAENVEMLKQFQQGMALTEIYKGFFGNVLNKEIFIFLSANKQVTLRLIKIMKTGDNYKPSEIMFSTTDERNPATEAKYSWLDDHLDDYLGWFELLFHVISAKLVDKDIAERLFKHYLSESMDARAVREYISPEAHLWADLKGLCNLFKVDFPGPNGV